MKHIRMAGVLALALVSAGCGAELLAGGQEEGEVSAVMADEVPGPQGSRAGMDPQLSRAAGAAPEGVVEAVAAVSLVRDDGAVVPITEGAAVARVRLSSADEAVLGTESVAVGRYTRARVTFTAVAADVTAGLQIGGVGITGLVTVRIAEPLVVEAPIAMTVREGSRQSVVVLLNSEAWLATASPLSPRQVAAADFAQAVRVRVRE